jgi:hypothetical protein
MKTKQLTNLPSFKAPLRINSITKAIAISSLAIGVASIFAAPVQAVVISTGTLAFNDGALLGSAPITTTGGTFTTNFNSGGNAIFTTASGSFGSLVLGVIDPTNSVSKPVAPSLGTTFSYTPVVGNSFTATLTNPLNFDFGSLLGKLSIASGATFGGIYNPVSTNFPSGHSFFNLNPGSIATFSSGSDTSPVQITSFNFDVDNSVGGISPNGSYSIRASAVPEPFTVIGTLVGGAAALRMRKKLANAAKN